MTCKIILYYNKDSKDKMSQNKIRKSEVRTNILSETEKTKEILITTRFDNLISKVVTLGKSN